MIVIARKTRRAAPARTPCNRAALAALGLSTILGGPALAAPAGTVLPANTIPVLRGLVSDYSQSATFSTIANVGGVGKTLTINQLVPKIILDWNSFDIGNGSIVQFIQPSSSSAVLNRIYSLDPTIVQGAIKANGQVYLVNQNGILFDRGTQINVNTLVASSLNISDAVFQKGVTSGGMFTPAFTGGYDSNGKTIAGATTGSITVGANGDAKTAAPAIAAQTGGAIVIIAPVIDNRSGIITSPDGQVILAAGTSAYLDFSATNDPGFRGMLVQVDAPRNSDRNLTSFIRNGATLQSDRGNVTLAGLAINQEGRVSASSAMLTNGSIYLQANTINDGQRGNLTLAAGSVTETPLDTTDATTMHQGDDWTPYRPVVNLTGAQIDVEGRVTSPSGKVTLNALDPANKANARIYLGAGSTIDASGAWSDAPDSSNLLTFKVTSNELADSPDQKGDVLLGKTVTVDLRTGSTLLDLSGYQANQARTLAQKATQGGIVSMTSSGSVVERTDATVDVSGGGIHYTGATEATSKLIGSDGKLYDISTAPEQLAYTKVADTFVDTQARWGYSQTWSNLLMGSSLKRPDYTQGAAGGTLAFTLGTGNNGLVLDGANLGGVTTGSQQLAAAPRAGTLTIGLFDPTKTTQDFGVGDIVVMPGTLSSLPAGFGATSVLGDANKAQVSLSTSLFAGTSTASGDNSVSTGFATVNLNSNGRVTVPEGVTLAGPAGGTLTVNANQVEIDGHVSVPAGTVSLSNVATFGTADSPVASSSIVVAQNAGIDTRGTWVNNALAGASATAPGAFLDTSGAAQSTANGGAISLAGTTVSLGAGSVLDVSAGGSVSTRGALAGGSAGSITLAAASATAAQPLVLDGTLRGEGFATGGQLNVSTAGTVQIGGSAGGGAALQLDPSLFTTGGFGAYSVTALGNLSVVSGTVLAPRQENLVFDPVNAPLLASGGDLRGVTTASVLTDSARKATNLTLASSGGTLTMQQGTGIGLDAGGSVGLSGSTGVSIDGTVYAPGGAINVSVNPSAIDSLAVAPQFELGSAGFLSARGTFVQSPSDKGLVTGTLLDAGSVNIKAQKATIALDAGSIIDVSGASQVVDQPAVAGATVPYTKVARSSNAGTLSITADDSVTLGGALRANADNSAAGGSFALTFTERGDLADTTSTRVIDVSQSGAAVAPVAGVKTVLISADKLAGSGFDKLRLTAEDQILFTDSTTLAFQRGVKLDSQSIGVANGVTAVVSGVSVQLADSFGLRAQVSPDDPHRVMDSTKATALQPTLAGTGTFVAKADTIDVTGSVTISGTSSVSLDAVDDLRLSGRAIGQANTAAGATFQGSLTTAGDLTLNAAQVYPTTASTFTVAVADGLTGTPVPGGTLRIGSSGATPGAVYSAGGSLTLSADHIIQAGVVKAPLGTLNLVAGMDLTLAPNSTTSVSADGLTVFYGETQGGVTWTYGAMGSDPLTASLTAPPAKQIHLTAPAVDVKTGATVDVSGGGDVAAVEFVSGSGGSKDALIQPNTYAIIPAANLSAAPIDPDIALTNPLGFGKDSAVYNSIHIGPGGAVPAGDYVLLPGYYGLLKGGYVVQLLTGSTYANLQSGQTATLANGLTVVPGTMTATGTSVASSSTIGVVVRPGSDIAKLADYTVTGSAYFAALADRTRTADPLLPTDGGQLSIAATQRLTLDGSLVASLPTATSRSAEVDIAASKIALVDQVGRGDIPSDYLQIDSSSLSRLDASLLIGGVRSTGANGLVVTPQASDIVVANSAAQELKAPEVILAATDSITVRAGSVVEGAGSRPSVSQDFSVGGAGAASGAIVRAANSGLDQVSRAAADSSQGTITVEAGATLKASGSLALDATRTTTSNGALSVGAGGGLSLVSGSLSLGDTAGLASGSSGLVLSNAQLAGFDSLGTLVLKSYGGIDVYGSAQIGDAALKNLVIDGGAITGHAAADGSAAAAQVAAAQVTLTNTSGNGSASNAAQGQGGALVVNAAGITLGAGDKVVGGFSAVQLQASGELLASGTGSLQAIAPLSLQAARIGSVGGADQSWSARGGTAADATYLPVTIAAVAPATPLADSTALGSRLTVAGSRIDDTGTITMKAGAVTLQAMGSTPGDGVQLGSGARIDATGFAQSFQGTVSVADAGRVSLQAANGTVGIAAGASVDVSASSQGGNAGSLSIQVGSLALQGQITAASASGQQGTFSLDVGALPSLAALDKALDAGSFNESRDLRVRTGDLTVAATDVVKTHHLVLESDAGAVTVQGRLDASAALGGGSVEIHGVDVNIASGAVIDASATSQAVGSTAPNASGGSVSLVAEGGTLTFAGGALIDVRAGAKGDAGSVLLRAPRTATGLQASLAGQVLSQRAQGSVAGEIDVEGNQVYGPALAGTAITADMIAGYAADNQSWLAAINPGAIAAGIRGDGGAAANVHVRPAVEVQAAGDLAIAQTWDLTGTGWLNAATPGATPEAGSLVVRAGGDLKLVSASLGMPDNSLVAGPTWNIALTSGADLGATDTSRTLSTTQLAAQSARTGAGAGDLVLDSHDAEASIRTGTGNIRLSAGRDFVIKSGVDANTGNAVVGVVYTAGQAAVVDQLTAPADSRFVQGGGNVTISAQRDAIGAGNEWMTEWFRSATDVDGGLDLGAWWAWRQTFHDGVAALGGGNVNVSAGNDIRTLSAWAPTSALKVGSGDTATLQTYGGGDVNLRAGGDILGGQCMVSLGKGSLQAGGSVGTAADGTQLFLMGLSGDPGLSQASLKVSAGQSIAIDGLDNPSTLFLTRNSNSSDPSFNSNGNLLEILSYSANSRATLSSLSGDVHLGTHPDAYATLDPANQSRVNRSPAIAAIYPAQLGVTAFGGSIVGSGTQGGGAVLFPSTSGSLKLLAQGSVTDLKLIVSDADPTAYAIQNVSEAINVIDSAQLLPKISSPNRIVTTTSTDTFVNDVVAQAGSVTNSLFTFPERARVWAGQDVVGTTINLQNTAASDVSEIVANTGSIARPPVPWGIGGPGTLLVQAGADIDLGNGRLTSSGNQNNQSLANPAGAQVDLLAGVTGSIDVTQIDAFFSKLATAGAAHDTAAAKTLVEGFFAGAKIGKGDIDSYNTSIQSVAGGGINLLAPGGNITVGLTTPPGATLIGVVTSNGGAIHSYLSGDFDINRGKVVTAQGGDILIYTADGGIDAGKGAKTSSTTPPPRRTPMLDNHGNIIGYTYSLPVAVTGSGIQTLTSKPGGPASVAPPAGNIYLFAPAGTIDAGEGGIASGGNIIVAALTVLNADNISSVGSSVGVPQVQVGSVASTVASSGATTSTNGAGAGDAAAQAAAAAAAASASSFRPAILTVEVMGFGDRNCKETDKDCFAK